MTGRGVTLRLADPAPAEVRQFLHKSVSSNTAGTAPHPDQRASTACSSGERRAGGLFEVRE